MRLRGRIVIPSVDDPGQLLDSIYSVDQSIPTSSPSRGQLLDPSDMRRQMRIRAGGVIHHDLQHHPASSL
jgi:hypothetical protein